MTLTSDPTWFFVWKVCNREKGVKKRGLRGVSFTQSVFNLYWRQGVIRSPNNSKNSIESLVKYPSKSWVLISLHSNDGAMSSPSHCHYLYLLGAQSDYIIFYEKCSQNFILWDPLCKTVYWVEYLWLHCLLYVLIWKVSIQLVELPTMTKIKCHFPKFCKVCTCGLIVPLLSSG